MYKKIPHTKFPLYREFKIYYRANLIGLSLTPGPIVGAIVKLISN